MASSKFLSILAVVVVITSIFSIGLVYLSARSLFSAISGYATSTGEANLTVESQATINFTTISISWGSGRVTPGANGASLSSVEGTNNVSGGNWSLITAGGLRLVNLGNVNVTLNLSGTKTAAAMIGGTGPVYKWNVSNLEASSCLNVTGGTDATPLGIYYDVNTTATALFCGRFRYADASDSIMINFNLTIPSDSIVGALGDTITATALATT
ncbi:MAG: hypothetical protein AABX96_03105 [Nanoarchaeota archaeon]